MKNRSTQNQRMNKFSQCTAQKIVNNKQCNCSSSRKPHAHFINDSAQVLIFSPPSPRLSLAAIFIMIEFIGKIRVNRHGTAFCLFKTKTYFTSKWRQNQQNMKNILRVNTKQNKAQSKKSTSHTHTVHREIIEPNTQTQSKRGHNQRDDRDRINKRCAYYVRYYSTGTWKSLRARFARSHSHKSNKSRNKKETAARGKNNSYRKRGRDGEKVKHNAIKNISDGKILFLAATQKGRLWMYFK